MKDIPEMRQKYICDGLNYLSFSGDDDSIRLHFRPRHILLHPDLVDLGEFSERERETERNTD